MHLFSTPGKIVITRNGPTLEQELPDRPYELFVRATPAALFQSNLLQGFTCNL